MTIGVVFGRQTVTFEAVNRGATGDSLGVKPELPVDVPVPGCRHRPLKADETPEYLLNMATQIWKTTAPPTPAVLGAKMNSRLKVDGVPYQIVGGPMPFADPWGQPFKVTIFSKVQVG